MKKILLLAATLFAGVSMSAQLKGDMSITGNLNFSGGNTVTTTTAANSTNTQKNPDVSQYGLGASFGYFVAENCELSLGLNYGLSREWTNWSDNDAKKKLFDSKNKLTVTPSFKYYVSIVDDLFYYTPNVYMGLGFQSGKSQISESETKQIENLPFVFDLGLDLASFEIKPSYNIGITFSLGGIYFTNESYKIEEGSGDTYTKIKWSRNTFDISLDRFLSPKIGVKFYFF